MELVRERRDFSDRAPIHNIWDQEQIFTALKTAPHDQIESTGRLLLKDADPYKVKLGIHLLRLGIWENPELARDWVKNSAPELMTHAHPRVKHSSLWNVRSAVWQDPSLAPQALQFAMSGLQDFDPAVQRVSIWTHGDSVINSPELFPYALGSIQEFLRANPKESNSLFALEEFFMPLRSKFSGERIFQEAVAEIRNTSDGFPGVKGRIDNIFGQEVVISDDDREAVKTRLEAQSEDLPEAGLIRNQQYDKALRYILLAYPDMETFLERMKSLWIVRDLCWVTGEPNPGAFHQIAELLTDTRDGDLTRTASVLLADSVIQFPKVLASDAIETVNHFFEGSDIDGSQIVVAQSLTPLRSQLATREILREGITSMKQRAANRSVEYALNCLGS